MSRRHDVSRHARGTLERPQETTGAAYPTPPRLQDGNFSIAVHDDDRLSFLGAAHVAAHAIAQLTDSDPSHEVIVAKTHGQVQHGDIAMEERAAS
jgi:hypothetical protein